MQAGNLLEKIKEIKSLIFKLGLDVTNLEAASVILDCLDAVRGEIESA